MKQQVIVIHGGGTFTTYDEYINSLTSWTISSLDDLKKKSWKSSLGEVLGEGYEVFNPSMPNKENAKYLEWRIWFEKILPHVKDNAIFIGHSLGGIFLVKYFSENLYNKNIKALFLVAAPYKDIEGEPLGDFNFITDCADLSGKIKTIYMYHSKDDYVVPFSHTKLYEDKLQKSIFRVFEDRGHFNQEGFSELVVDIMSL